MRATDLDPLAHPDTPVWGVPPNERPDLIVDRNLLRMLLGTDDRDWGHDNLHLKELHAAGHRGKGVVVAIVDTGLDAAHPDLAPQVVARADFTGQGTEDGNGHGTHCGGIAAAAENGISPEEARALLPEVDQALDQMQAIRNRLQSSVDGLRPALKVAGALTYGHKA